MHREKNGIRREYLELARARFQWNAVDDAEKALPEIQELVNKRKDPKVRAYERAKFMNAVRRKLFGCVPDPEAESDEHAAEIEDFKARRKSMPEAEFVRYVLGKVREKRAKGHHEEVIARMVDAMWLHEALDLEKREAEARSQETDSRKETAGASVVGSQSSVEAEEKATSDGYSTHGELQPSEDHRSPGLTPSPSPIGLERVAPNGGEGGGIAEQPAEQGTERGALDIVNDECRTDADCGPVSGGKEG